MKSFFDTVFHRASVRSFNSDPISDAEWDTLLKSAMAAPSAVNKQPWDFIVIDDRRTLDALAAELPYAKMAAEAPAAVVVCAVPARANEGKLEYAVVDASLACENLLLAADALGLGAVWTALYPQSVRENVARRVLGIPEDVVPLAFVPIGKPRGETKAKDKFLPGRIHRGRW
jgi:nitroreductase